jgi:hypothetical protein
MIAFAQNWQPWVLPIGSSFGRSPMTAPYLARVKLTLRPLFERLGTPWSPPPTARKKLIVLGILGALGACMGLLWLALTLPQYFYEPPAIEHPAQGLAIAPPADAYDAALERFKLRLKALPEFEAAAQHATNANAAREWGRELASKGLARLSDDELARRELLLQRTLAVADDASCAGWWTNTASLEPALRRLPREELEQWFDISFAATVAELRQAPAPPAPPQAAVDQAMQRLLDSLSASDAELLRSTFAAPGTKSADDVCRAVRLLYARLPKLPERSRAVLNRALVQL